MQAGRDLVDGGTAIPPTSGSSRLDEALREAAMRDPLLDPRTDRERLVAVRDIIRRHSQKTKTRVV